MSALEEKFDSFKLQHEESDGVLVERPASSFDHKKPVDRTTTVSLSKTSSWIEAVLQDPKNRLAFSALSSTNPRTILEKPSAILKDTQTTNVKIPFEGSPVTNQRSSGRCWIFASTNSIIETADEEVDSRLINTLMASPVGDGGQWDMVSNLVQKYGLVPQPLYPDSWNAMNSSVMDSLLTTKLREDGLRLRELAASHSRTASTSITQEKEKMMQDIVRILALTLGPPPGATDKFTWEYCNKDGKFKTLSVTPLEFAGGLNDTHGLRACGGTDVQNLFSLVNDARNKYNTHLTVDHLGNVWGGRPTTYTNIDTTTMKTACIAMLKKGWPIFFGSDVGKYSDSAKGIMDTDLIDYELGFNVKLGMTEAQRLLTNESAMTHAMVLTAVHLDEEGRSDRWRVENSWSETAGTKGCFVMSDEWFDEFCYQAVVDPTVVSKEINDILEQKPKVLPVWDPLGALA
ncbi:bleomycin hydrolase-like protein [Tothia fuscella]|uniref:Cysteine proteinase 1, mitochondrial n=1 Tax=Tothia fuscella TaxID=1048955 RepID=A0A9P4U143_9PEZI|nr:bleomycin hydrolase-like protein [Tothia fuscella]